MRGRWWLSLLACAAAAPAAAAPAAAQQVTPEPTVTQRCLVVLDGSPGVPEYPFDELKRGERGSVKVDLAFQSPGRPPTVTVLASQGSAAFVEAVRSHARQMRVPCMEPADAPARLILEFVFRPDDRKVVASEQTGPEELRRAELMACLQHESGSLQPQYPPTALRTGVAGRVHAQLRFTDAAKPPEAKVFARRYARLLKFDIERTVEGYRLPCLTGGPVTASFTYDYKFEGHREHGVRNLTLTQFLALTKDIHKQRLSLDTTAMSCPFDLEIHYLQPELDNAVEQIASHNAARGPLVDFLRKAQLMLDEASANAAFGDSFTLSVPCLTIDLKPKE